MFQWAYLFFGFSEWACEPIFQTLSILLLEKSLKVIKSLISIKIDDFFNTGILLESL